MAIELKIRLDHFLNECPIWWQNFIRDFNPVGRKAWAIDDHLKLFYNASYTPRKGIFDNSFVEFKTIGDLIYFVLRWG